MQQAGQHELLTEDVGVLPCYFSGPVESRLQVQWLGCQHCQRPLRELMSLLLAAQRNVGESEVVVDARAFAIRR